MDPLQIVLTLGALLVLASLLGVLWSARQGRVSRSGNSSLPPDVPTKWLDHSAPVTLLQFSGPFCSYCDAMRRILSRAAEESGGVVAHRELDITEHRDLTESLRITQTPTTLIVSNTGHLLARISGAAKPPVVQAEIDNALAARKAASDEYLI
jgi:thiol-disulfide isomerase/thioredoxin